MITNAAELRSAIESIGKHDPDPGVVTEKILAGLTDADAHVVAQVTLRDYVRHVLTNPASASVAQETARYATGSGQQSPSAATAALIDWYSAELSKSVFVEDRWIRLGQCTFEDLQHLIGSRRRKAADLSAEAEKYERLAEVMEREGVATVADLSVDVGREVLKK
jgi:hypothetical protein